MAAVTALVVNFIVRFNYFVDLLLRSDLDLLVVDIVLLLNGYRRSCITVLSGITRSMLICLVPLYVVGLYALVLDIFNCAFLRLEAARLPCLRPFVGGEGVEFSPQLLILNNCALLCGLTSGCRPIKLGLLPASSSFSSLLFSCLHLVVVVISRMVFLYTRIVYVQ